MPLPKRFGPSARDTGEVNIIIIARLCHEAKMGRTQVKNSPPSTMIAPVFWAWAQEQATPDEPLHVTRRRAIQMQLQADADLAKAVHREAFLAIMRVQRG